jgi:hypothetical protein
LRNPFGFGVLDGIEILAAALLVALFLARPTLERIGSKLAPRTLLCMVMLCALPIMLRLVLLPHFPVPTASGSDDFSHLLVADTLLHGRMANPAHPFHRFFEAIYVLQEPRYSSMYPPGLGIFLAIGRLVFGHAWAGMIMTSAGFCALCYWMLRAWVTPGWALAGGLLAVFQFGPLCQWMNTYWANAIPALAGCLVFGSLGRILVNGPRGHYGVLIGTGVALHLITRPFETMLLSAAVLLFLPLLPWRSLPRLALVAVLPVIPAVVLLAVQNHAVTGEWTKLPYMLSRYQYGIPTTFVFEANPVPHRPLTQEQDLNYRAQSAVHGEEPETVRSFFERLGYRVRYYRFFFLPPLYLAEIAFLLTVRSRKFAWVIGTVLVFELGSNLYPYFYPHYIGAATSLFVLISVVGLSKLERWGINRLLFMLCATIFLAWYDVRLSGDETVIAATVYDNWNFVNHGDPEGRVAINRRLDSSPGRQLVFVRYAPNHGFHEWIHNDADIDRARVVWALDLGDAENRKLIQYFGDRRVWIVDPDAQPPRLEPYR